MKINQIQIKMKREITITVQDLSKMIEVFRHLKNEEDISADNFNGRIECLAYLVGDEMMYEAYQIINAK